MATPAHYVGRFAPSPTGALHLGSLVAALGSYLDARHHGGKWLVRIEDLDASRVIPGCADQILRTLECFGLSWDGDVEYQSRNIDRYHDAIQTLRQRGRTFECACSRRVLADTEDRGYPGTCRELNIRARPSALRFRVDDACVIEFADRFQGVCRFEMRALGDVVIRRRDGVVAYQLAVVVDDAHQGITHVVRGADLLMSTGWQLALQAALDLPSPAYAHVPLIVEPGGAKLAKSRRAIPLNAAAAVPELRQALALLKQKPALQLTAATAAELLAHASKHWDPTAFACIERIEA